MVPLGRKVMEVLDGVSGLMPPPMLLRALKGLFASRLPQVLQLAIPLDTSPCRLNSLVKGFLLHAENYVLLVNLGNMAIELGV